MEKTIAVPFCAGEYLDFWKIIKVSENLYKEAVIRCAGVVNITNRLYDKKSLEKLLKTEKTRLKREQWTVERAKASMKLYQAEKEFWKDLSVAKMKKGTITL